MRKMIIICLFLFISCSINDIEIVEYYFKRGEIVKHKLTCDTLIVTGCHENRVWCRDKKLEEKRYWEWELEKIK